MKTMKIMEKDDIKTLGDLFLNYIENEREYFEDSDLSDRERSNYLNYDRETFDKIYEILEKYDLIDNFNELHKCYSDLYDALIKAAEAKTNIYNVIKIAYNLAPLIVVSNIEPKEV